MFALFAASATPAFADSSPFELYCPGTPVGNIVLNGVVTTGTITPASPASGTQFNLTNYQSTVSLPASIVSAAAALGNSAIAGTATLKVDATGATPASVAAPPITINAPIPSPVPSTGLSLVLPSTAGTVGPFTASGGRHQPHRRPGHRAVADRVGQHAHPDVHAVPEQQRHHRHRRARRPRPPRRPR